MRKIRNYLVAIVLVMSLGGSAFLGLGAGSIASAVSSQHVGASALIAKSTRSVSLRPQEWCPGHGIGC